MYCITRNDMKFGQYFIPARTRARVINTPSSRDANLPGLHLEISIRLFDFHPKKLTGVPCNEVETNNELENKSFGRTSSTLSGITITTHGDQVYLDAGDKFYDEASLSKWKVNQIFGETIPTGLELKKYTNEYYLFSVVEYLEEDFAEWVKNNCEFRKLTQKDIDNGEGFDGANPGDKTLSNKGLNQFYEKQLEFQKRLEVTGFTYEFKGGLIWD